VVNCAIAWDSKVFATQLNDFALDTCPSSVTEVTSNLNLVGPFVQQHIEAFQILIRPTLA
jgi:hypothetical protein